ETLSGGKSLSAIARNLLDAIDPEKIEAEAGRARPPGAPLQESDLQSASEKLAKEAATVIATNPDLRKKILDIQRAADQTIDTVSQDRLLFAGADAKTTEAARDTIKSFRDYIEQHKAEIEALQILYSRPFKKRLTEESLREFEAKLKPEFGPQPVPKIWNAFCSSGSASRSSVTRRFTDLVSLVRTAIEPTTPLEPFEEHVRQRFATWLDEKRAAGITFEADQLAWLEKMRDYISASGSVDREHLEADNVLGPLYKTFGEKLWPLMDELNLTLAA
ncbi:MAG: restriction endonuclease subunit R, partial [Verrucomicrobia bacterium]|nr:restriction endonuclease subunit R [Verrucomicrobiota bacterium]